jgi:uncharacterized protein
MYHYQPSPYPNTRVDAADILRGIAIAGIILIHFLEHMGLYYYPVKPTFIDSTLRETIFFLMAGKMYGIFAMLFGLSFFIQHDNQAKKGIDFRPRFVWRMVLLAGWGLLDLVFYNGDILLLYAICGLLVLPLIRLSNKALCYIALFLAIQPVELIYIVLGLINPELRPLNLGSGPLYAGITDIQINGSFFEVAKSSITDGFLANTLWTIEYGRMTQTVFFFVLGIIVGRMRFLYDENNNRTYWKKVLGWSIVAFAITCPLVIYIPDMIDNRCVKHSLVAMFTMWRNLSMLCFYVTGITWLFHCTDKGKKLVFVAPYGKMSLTNYISQSIIGTFIFYEWGLGWYKYSSHTYSLLMGVMVIIVQFIFCRWWMKHHKRGPLEEIWRKATWIDKK